MKQALLLLITWGAMVPCFASHFSGHARLVVPMAYELYSWQESNGSWNFCILASPSGVNVSAEQVFNKKCLLDSVKELRRKISALPVGATIFWPGQISSETGEEAKESKKLSYPPSETMEYVRRCAEARKITLEVFSAQRKQE